MSLVEAPGVKIRVTPIFLNIHDVVCWDDPAAADDDVMHFVLSQ
jgi:hypothetical protein